MRVPFTAATTALLSAFFGLSASGPAVAQVVERPAPVPLVAPALELPDELPRDRAEAPASLPTGFLDQTLPLTFNQALGLVVGPDGRLYVWERGGKVWFVEDGVKADAALLDISEEVALWGDHGLLGFALDPDYLRNGYIYALYVVDYHYLTTFGTPAYDPAFTLGNQDTIGRLTRYTVDIAGGFQHVVSGSRRVLIGEDINTGLPVCNISHGVGSLVFGEDGTLLVSFGDGYGLASSNTCLADGIITEMENVGAWRAQLVNSLAGKILRVDPATGDGLPSNPYYSPLAPRAPRSRVWALGLRSPYRFGLRPGTGVSDPSLGRPGTLLIGDVGEGDWEELNVVRNGGTNFGWPSYEGMDPFEDPDPVPANLAAPNPLFGVDGCLEPYFDFEALLVPDGLLPPSWPNPCDPFLQVPPHVPTFQHTRPIIDWSHDGTARVSVYDHQGVAIAQLVGPTSPVSGPQFGGISSIGGAWHSGEEFPLPFRDVWFHADYGAGWIQAFKLDADDRPVAVHAFAQVAGSVVAVASDDATGRLYYLNYLDPTESMLHEIRFVPGNLPPTAVIGFDPGWGAAPLTVSFEGSASSDPEGGALSWSWSFGDGTPDSYVADPVHVFPSEDITMLGDIIASVDELQPPVPMGLGSLDKEVLRDGDIPPPGSPDLDRQYDTFHYGPGFVPDKGGEDWVGYTFPMQRTFYALLFQEGLQYTATGDGGWFDTLEVQVRIGGVWQMAAGMDICPVYTEPKAPGYEIYEIRFDPVAGDGIRLHGVPGGTFEFVSVGELRVVAAPLATPGLPTNFGVTLSVTDPLATTDTATKSISINNSPPQVQILSPDNGAIYPDDQPSKLPLIGFAEDAEHDPGDLICGWQVFLHHNDHVHPDPVDPICGTTATLGLHGSDGDVRYYEIRFTVADPLGLSGSISHYLVPASDLNLNGIDDALDIAGGTSTDSNGNGVPDEAEIDCNANGISDLLELTVGLSPDLNGNGVPDRCDPYVFETLIGPAAMPPKPL
jgi:glucose/arabinose dehydrogenase